MHRYVCIYCHNDARDYRLGNIYEACKARYTCKHASIGSQCFRLYLAKHLSFGLDQLLPVYIQHSENFDFP